MPLFFSCPENGKRLVFFGKWVYNKGALGRACGDAPRLLQIFFQIPCVPRWPCAIIEPVPENLSDFHVYTNGDPQGGGSPWGSLLGVGLLSPAMSVKPFADKVGYNTCCDRHKETCQKLHMYTSSLLPDWSTRAANQLYHDSTQYTRNRRERTEKFPPGPLHFAVILCYNIGTAEKPTSWSIATQKG